MYLRKTLAVAATLAWAGVAQASPLDNTGFESGLSSWNTSGNVTTVGGGNVPDGGSMAKLVTGSGTEKLWQYAADSLGSGFTLWYKMTTTDFLGCGCNEGDTLNIWYKGATGSWQSITTIDSVDVASGNTGWLSFVLPSDTKSLRIWLTGDGDSYKSKAFVDITGANMAAAVPEPGEWAMILAGLGMVGVISRRRSFKG
jgi:hypothetical protein